MESINEREINMSIWNDYRRYSENEDEYAEWEDEMKSEYRRQDAIDREYEEKMMECDADE